MPPTDAIVLGARPGHLLRAARVWQPRLLVLDPVPFDSADIILFVYIIHFSVKFIKICVLLPKLSQQKTQVSGFLDDQI